MHDHVRRRLVRVEAMIHALMHKLRWNGERIRSYWQGNSVFADIYCPTCRKVRTTIYLGRIR